MSVKKKVEPPQDPFSEVDETCRKLVRLRKRPVLILYYDLAEGFIDDEDLEDVYNELRARGWSRGTSNMNLDVLIHTWGGNPNAAYRIAQIIRDFASHVAYLVPQHAASAGTLTCLGGNEIRLGAYALLGPLDIEVGDIEVASIENFKKFAVDCCEAVVEMLGQQAKESSTQVESALLVEMVKQLGSDTIGSLYRERDLTARYAKRLMLDYLFSGLPNKEILADEISDKLVGGFPSHDFAIDYHMAKELDLPVVEMDERESELSKSVVKLLDGLVDEGIICKNIGKRDDVNYKAPFIRLYEGENLGLGTGGNEER
jgi:hypothetical protein